MLISKSVRAFLPFALAVSVAAAVAGSLTEMTVHTWYVGLAKPTWTAPAQIYGPVWTLIYACMALAAFLVYKKEGWPTAQKALTLWGIQLVLNAFWPGFFFALRNPALGSIEIVVLLGFVVATTAALWQKDRHAGLLMVPYCLWGSYATALTIAIWHMNRIHHIHMQLQ